MSIVETSVRRSADAVEELWYTRCPVPTASGIALQKGWLQREFEPDGIRLQSIRASEERAVRRSHYDHSHPNSFREGGNVPPLWARANGQDTALIGITWVDEEQLILVRPGSDIRSVADLRGRRLGLPKHRSEIVDIGRAEVLKGYANALRTHRMTTNDVILVDVEGGDFDLRENHAGPRGNATRQAMLELLLNGEIDALYAKGAYSAVLVEDHKLQVVVDLNRLSDQYVTVNAGTPRPITVSRGLLEARPDLVTRYLTILVLTAQWAAGHRAEVIKAIAAETGAAEDSVRKAYGPDLHRKFQPTLSAAYIGALRHQKSFLVNRGFLGADFDLDAWIAPDPLQRARELVAAGRARLPSDPVSKV